MVMNIAEQRPRGLAQCNENSELERHGLVVGCALLPKKVARYLTPRMLQTAAEHSILLKQIDYTQPLGPQGPFDVIIHKLRPNLGWEQQLRQYVSDHPQVVVVDRLDKIRQLHNRATMLRPLQGSGILLTQPLAQPSPTAAAPQQQQQQSQGRQVLVQAPLQAEIAEGTSEADAAAALAAAGLAPPLLCKPLWTDGRDGSHKLAVLHDLEALGRLLRGAVCSEFKPPLVVQQFVEHGGVLFKVYVLGSQTFVTARPSLGETVLDPDRAVQQLPRISCVSVFSKQQQHQGSIQQARVAAPAGPAVAAAAAAGGGDVQHVQGGQRASTEQQQPSAALAAVTAESVWRPPSSIVAPPAWLTSALAATLRQELGMQLFNFDLIVPEQQPCDSTQQQQQQQQVQDPDAAPPLCYVVDINFFPGVDKIPDFEQRFVQFLLAAAAAGPDGPDHPSGQQQQQQQSPVAAAAAASGGSRQQEREGSLGGNARPQCVSTPGSSSGCETVGRRGSSSGGATATAAAGSCGGGGRCLQHSLSAGRAASAAAAASGGSTQHHSRRLSGAGSSSGGGSSRHGGGLEVVGSASWGDMGVLGSSPPQLQVAGCS